MTFWEKVRRYFSRGGVKQSGGYVRAPTSIRGDYSLQNSEIIYAAVSRISNALSAMPVRLCRGYSPVGKDDPLIWLNDLVSRSPNPNMTSSDFFKTLEAVRDTSGNAYALKILLPDYSLERLDVLDPARVSPVWNEDTNELWYRLQTDAGELVVHQYHILHFKFISTNGYFGISPVLVLQNTLGYMDRIEKLSTEQLQKGVNNAVVLEAPVNLGAEQREKTVKAFLETYKKTSGNILLLESGVIAKSLNLSPIDSHMFEVEKITRSRVAMVYNIPPHLLGDYSDASFNTMEQQQLEFLQLTMLPIVNMYEQVLGRGLLTDGQAREGYRFRFDMDNLLRGDTAARAEANFKAVRSAWKKPNEIRAEEGNPPEPDGDELYISKDLVPLSLLKTLSMTEGGDGK